MRALRCGMIGATASSRTGDTGCCGPALPKRARRRLSHIVGLMVDRRRPHTGGQGDATSLVLHQAVERVLIGPGTYSCHEGHWRRILPSTSHHNALAFGKRNQAEYLNRFIWGKRPDVHMVVFNVTRERGRRSERGPADGQAGGAVSGLNGIPQVLALTLWTRGKGRFLRRSDSACCRGPKWNCGTVRSL